MPPDRGRPYGQPYREGHGDGYGTDAYGRDPYGQGTDSLDNDPYARRGEFQAAVDALDDPLRDPLPGQGSPPASGYQAQGYTSQGQSPHGQPASGQQPQGYQGNGHQDPGQQAHRFSTDGYAAQQQDGLSPWFRPRREPGGTTQSGYVAPPAGQQHPQRPQHSQHPQPQGYTGQALYEGAAPTRQRPQQPQQYQRPQQPQQPQHAQRPQQPGPYGAPEPGAPARRGRTDGRVRESRVSETAALPVVDMPDAARGGLSTDDRHGAVGEEYKSTQTVGLVRPGAEELTGYAAHRHAHRRGRRGGAERDPETSSLSAGTRLEARRAARARREGPAIVASRFLGEVFISVGVVMLLFVAYQLWWTNVLAGQEAGGAAKDLQEQWDSGKGGKGSEGDKERKADSFAPGEGFAILYIPKLDVRVPIAQGVSKPAVLDKGLVGHYDGKPVKSAMPWDKKGNFALAGHRNTHGEPFRYINRLVGGDEMVVETETKFYTYKMANRLPSTPPSDTGVIGPVPQQSGFKEPGRYITLTTCTPEFTSKYRLIVWGKMVEERPRSKGKPDALLG
jgi:sortase A